MLKTRCFPSSFTPDSPSEHGLCDSAGFHHNVQEFILQLFIVYKLDRFKRFYNLQVKSDQKVSLFQMMSIKQ